MTISSPKLVDKPCTIGKPGAYVPLRGQLCAAHDWTQHAESLVEKKSRKKLRGGGGPEEHVCVVLGSRWVYLHISLRHCKTHPDKPHWHDEKSRGEGQEGEKDTWGGGHKQRCTVPKPEWTNVTREKKTQERKIHYFTPMQHAENCTINI